MPMEGLLDSSCCPGDMDMTLAMAFLIVGFQLMSSSQGISVQATHSRIGIDSANQ